MPERLKWIVEWYDNKADVPQAVRDQYLDSHGLETVPMPVMSLDDLEAWLKEEQQGNLETYVPNRLTYTDGLDRLLAQVQRWKEGKA